VALNARSVVRSARSFPSLPQASAKPSRVGWNFRYGPDSIGKRCWGFSVFPGRGLDLFMKHSWLHIHFCQI
jgi:hypothetical protein